MTTENSRFSKPQIVAFSMLLAVPAGIAIVSTGSDAGLAGMLLFTFCLANGFYLGVEDQRDHIAWSFYSPIPSAIVLLLVFLFFVASYSIGYISGFKTSGLDLMTALFLSAVAFVAWGLSVTAMIARPMVIDFVRDMFDPEGASPGKAERVSKRLELIVKIVGSFLLVLSAILLRGLNL